MATPAVDMPHQNQAESLYERAARAAEFIRAKTDLAPQVALILGSGLGAFAESLQESVAVPYEEIPGFARSTVQGHAGQLVIGKTGDAPVFAMQGRFHYYEGYTLEQATLPVRAFGLLGVKTLLITNAAGGVNCDFLQGTLMVISDHLNLIGDSPLRGVHDERFGARFPDLSEVYAVDYQEAAVTTGNEIGLRLRRGIYAALSGPSYETPAEVRMLRTLGADAVGMSTVPEAIVARQMGIKVLGISCITNLAAGILDEPINHSEVMETGERVREDFTRLLERLIPRL